jgi:predicted RNA-binding Zn-ribbon protein involved in translation (DUF1610 family)
MKNCKECKKKITSGDKRNEFCCRSCSAVYNNKKRIRKKKKKYENENEI